MQARPDFLIIGTMLPKDIDRVRVVVNGACVVERTRRQIALDTIRFQPFYDGARRGPWTTKGETCLII